MSMRLPAEAADLRWFGWEELPRLDLDPGLRRALAKARGYCPLGGVGAHSHPRPR